MPRGKTKHATVVEYLQECIRSETLRPGDQLPSEPDLAALQGVSYMTARNAVSQLVDSGVLYRVKGRGTFVAEPTNENRLPSLGLLLVKNWHSIDPFYFPPLVSGFVEHATQAQFQVHIADRSEPLIETLKFKELRVRAVACVIIDAFDVEDADALLNHGVGVVAVNLYRGSRRVPSVAPENRRGAFNMAKALLDLGHRDFAFLAGPNYILDAVERKKGFDAAVKAFGEAVTVSVSEAPFSEEAGYEYAKKLTRRAKLPTAIVCSSDLTAIGCLKALLEVGIQIPQEISVTGFGDFRLSSYFHPSLTTVRIPVAELGRTAAGLLIRLYQRGQAEPVKIDCPIIWRESAGAPRS